jgi:hypothetical protein
MNRQMKLAFSFCYVLFSLVGGCATPERQLTREIIETPVDKRASVLARFPADKQLDIFMYAYTKMEPPRILAGELASNWRTTLPVVKAHLMTDTDEVTLSGMMMILSAVSSQYCSLEDRSDILTAASQAVGKIRAPHRELAEQQLKQIAHPEMHLPPCQ